MPETDKFLNANDVQGYLNNSFVLFQGEPAWVERTHPSMEVDLIFPLTDDKAKVSANHPDLSVRNIRLGFYNTPVDQQMTEPVSSPLFLSRVPIRQMKQGINKHSYSTYSPVPSGHLTFRLKNMAKTIKGIYPSFEEARDSAGRKVGRAFSRNAGFTLLQDTVVAVYRNMAVGLYNPEANSLWLHPSGDIRKVREEFRNTEITAR